MSQGYRVNRSKLSGQTITPAKRSGRTISSATRGAKIDEASRPLQRLSDGALSASSLLQESGQLSSFFRGQSEWNNAAAQSSPGYNGERHFKRPAIVRLESAHPNHT
jgi:hypothetical protein